MTKYLSIYLILLFRPSNFIVELGVVQSEATVHGKCLERFFVLLKTF